MAENQLVYYNAAKQALQQAASIDEVKDVKDKAEAIRLYAQQQRDEALEQYATRIKARAMRRIGELSADLETSKGGANPAATLPTNGTSKTKTETLASAGISKSTAHRCEKLAAIPEEKFEAAIEKGETTTDILRSIERSEKREQRISNISAPTLSLEKLYPLIYCDPPWRYEHSETVSREIENQYPTMDLEEIKTLKIPAAENCILFMWATSPKLHEAMSVIDAWGFSYRTCMVWVKDKIGMGYYARQKHELLLIAMKGSVPVPLPAARPSSVIEAPRGRHSEKPEEFYDLIHKMYPDLPKIELFSRKANPHFDAWGLEAEDVA